MLHFFAKRLKKLHEVERDERGFTLIELLVVIIIIGVLAAIAIPTFLAQRERAWEAAAQSDLRNAAAAATSCSSANDGSFDGCEPVNLEPFGFNPSENVTLTDEQSDAQGWASNSTNTLDDGTVYTFDTDNAGGIQGRVFCNAAASTAPGDADCA